jgi:tryptophan 2,3-dioxygenase
MDERVVRPIEDGVATDLRGELTYAGYLQLPTLLAAQQPVSDHHDEMLFIVQHQVTELWLKQLIHELRSAIALIAADDPSPALKRLARVKAIQRQMFEQWSVLETLTPVEYVQFRDSLGKASGFQSPQYRTVEFLLGNKNPQMITVFDHDPALHDALLADLQAPSLYDVFLRSLARRGGPGP